MTPLASIIIVTYGQREMTERCLRSLVACLGDDLGSTWELVLVDNDSPDDTPDLLAKWSDRAVVRLLQENRNFAGGCNLGAAEASGETLVFLNNDTEVSPGALETIAEQAREPGVSVAGCRLLFPDGTLQHGGVAFLRGRVLGGAAMPQHVFHTHDGDIPATRVSYELDAVTAACMAVRASTFRQVGGFNEAYINGLEDIDLCLKIRMTGERIVYRGDATVIHHEGASRGRGAQLCETPERLAAMAHNDHLFVSTWGTHLVQDDELAASVWDAELQNGSPWRHPIGGEVAVMGQPRGIGSSADEARALISSFAAAGLIPVAVDAQGANVIARLDRTDPAVQAATRRALNGAPWIIVPTGASDSHEVPEPNTILRLAQARTATPIGDVARIWAASPAVASSLVQAGASSTRVDVVPSPVMPAQAGPGGGGVLAVLPVHDPGRARAVLGALGGLEGRTTIRLVPTAMARGLEQEVADALPAATLCRPCADETRFAELAASADVVLAVDPDDRFERRALVAANVGAAVVTADRLGPAAAVLGAEVACDLADLTAAVRRAIIEPGDRAERAERVARACAPSSVAERLADVPVGVR